MSKNNTFNMRTVAESENFSRYVDDYWNEFERMEFIVYISQTPEAGIIIPSSGGLRMVRWLTSGKKSVQIIYDATKSTSKIWLLTIYHCI